MYSKREFHDLRTGDLFSFEQGGAVYKVDDASFIDAKQAGTYFQDRLVMYRAEDGNHAHLANHDPVWLIAPDF